MNAMKRPAQATKKVCDKLKLKVLRLRCMNLSVEDIAFKIDKTPRQTARILDALKDKLGATCQASLIHRAHAHGIIWACKEELEHWLEDHKVWRKAA